MIKDLRVTIKELDGCYFPAVVFDEIFNDNDIDDKMLTNAQVESEAIKHETRNQND